MIQWYYYSVLVTGLIKFRHEVSVLRPFLGYLGLVLNRKLNVLGSDLEVSFYKLIFDCRSSPSSYSHNAVLKRLKSPQILSWEWCGNHEVMMPNTGNFINFWVNSHSDRCHGSRCSFELFSGLLLVPELSLNVTVSFSMLALVEKLWNLL